MFKTPNKKQSSIMKKITLSLLCATLVGILPAEAGTVTFKEKVVYEPIEECNFRDMEFQLDVFYSGFYGGKGTAFSTGSGGGFGLNFFFARYFGIGYEAQWYDNNGEAEHLPVGGNFFLRYPICSLNLAPYAIVGGGAAWNGHGKGYGNVGGGLEWRFIKNLGLFAEGRYFYGGTGNVANLRSGLRIAF